MEWRDNLHRLIKFSLQLPRKKDIPPIVIDAIDSAYLQGIKDGQAKMNNSGRLLYQDGYKSALTELLESLPKERPTVLSEAEGSRVLELYYDRAYGFNDCLWAVKALITKMLNPH
jgi:hypothetical protein